MPSVLKRVFSKKERPQTPKQGKEKSEKSEKSEKPETETETEKELSEHKPSSSQEFPSGFQRECTRPPPPPPEDYSESHNSASEFTNDQEVIQEEGTESGETTPKRREEDEWEEPEDCIGTPEKPFGFLSIPQQRHPSIINTQSASLTQLQHRSQSSPNPVMNKKFKSIAPKKDKDINMTRGISLGFDGDREVFVKDLDAESPPLDPLSPVKLGDAGKMSTSTAFNVWDRVPSEATIQAAESLLAWPPQHFNESQGEGVNPAQAQGDAEATKRFLVLYIAESKEARWGTKESQLQDINRKLEPRLIKFFQTITEMHVTERNIRFERDDDPLDQMPFVMELTTRICHDYKQALWKTRSVHENVNASLVPLMTRAVDAIQRRFVSDVDDGSGDEEHEGSKVEPPMTATFEGATQYTNKTSLEIIAFQRLFKMPFDELLLQDFSAAFRHNGLWHGRLYISQRHICFNCQFFGKRIRHTVSGADILDVKNRTFFAIPNALKVQTTNKNYFYTSFVPTMRKTVLKWIKAVMHDTALHDAAEDIKRKQLEAKQKLEKKATKDKNEHEEEEEHEDHEENEENRNEEEEHEEEEDDHDIFSDNEEPGSSGPPLPKTLDLATPPQLLEEADEFKQSETWKTTVKNVQIPISKQEIFDVFFEDNCAASMEHVHVGLGDMDIKFSGWINTDGATKTRELTFQRKLPPMPFAPDKCTVSKIMRYSEDPNDKNVFRVSCYTKTDATFGDCFDIIDTMSFTQNSTDQSVTFSAMMNINFVKVPWKLKPLKGTIETRCFDDTKKMHVAWQKHVLDHLGVKGSVAAASVSTDEGGGLDEESAVEEPPPPPPSGPFAQVWQVLDVVKGLQQEHLGFIPLFAWGAIFGFSVAIFIMLIPAWFWGELSDAAESAAGGVAGGVGGVAEIGWSRWDCYAIVGIIAILTTCRMVILMREAQAAQSRMVGQMLLLVSRLGQQEEDVVHSNHSASSKKGHKHKKLKSKKNKGFLSHIFHHDSHGLKHKDKNEKDKEQTGLKIPEEPTSGGEK